MKATEFQLKQAEVVRYLLKTAGERQETSEALVDFLADDVYFKVGDQLRSWGLTGAVIMSLIDKVVVAKMSMLRILNS